MKLASPSSPESRARVLVATLLSFAIVIMPFAQLAAATRGKQRADDRAAKNVATDNLFVNPPAAPLLPGPKPGPARTSVAAGRISDGHDGRGADGDCE